VWCESYLIKPWELVGLLILVYTHTTVISRFEPHRMPDEWNPIQPLRIEGNYDYHEKSFQEQIYRGQRNHHRGTSLDEEFLLELPVLRTQLIDARGSIHVLDLLDSEPCTEHNHLST